LVTKLQLKSYLKQDNKNFNKIFIKSKQTKFSKQTLGQKHKQKQTFMNLVLDYYGQNFSQQVEGVSNPYSHTPSTNTYTYLPPSSYAYLTTPQQMTQQVEVQPVQAIPFHQPQMQQLDVQVCVRAKNAPAPAYITSPEVIFRYRYDQFIQDPTITTINLGNLSIPRICMDANNSIVKRAPLSILKNAKIPFKLQNKVLWFKDAGTSTVTGIHLIRGKEDPIKKPGTYFEHGIEIFTLYISYELIFPRTKSNKNLDERILETFKQLTVADADPFQTMLKVFNYAKILRKHAITLPETSGVENSDSEMEDHDPDHVIEKLFQEQNEIEKMTQIAKIKQEPKTKKKAMPDRSAKITK
jgi:hypothetical protein